MQPIRHLFTSRRLVGALAATALAFGSLGLSAPAWADDGTAGTTPITTTSIPITTTDAPITAVDEPITTTDAPITAVDEPVAVTDEPVTTTDEDVSTTDVTQTVTQEPINDAEPVVDEPVVDETVVDEPVVDEPVVDEPTVTTTDEQTEPTIINPDVSAVPDQGFRACLNTDYLDQDASAPISRAQLEALTPPQGTINCLSDSIASIAGAQYLVNVTTLDLYNNSISDLSPLAGLVNLKTLILDSNQISNVTPLAGLVNLTTLVLDSNKISNIAPLVGMTAMEQLFLYGNQISDLAPLAGMTQLNALEASNNNISNVTPLAGLSHLVFLTLNNNHVTDLSSLTSSSLRWTTSTTPSGGSTVTTQTAPFSVVAGQATALPVRFPLADRPVSYTITYGNATITDGTITVPQAGQVIVTWTIPGDVFTGKLTITATPSQTKTITVSKPVLCWVTNDTLRAFTTASGAHGITLRYEWLRDGQVIAGATGSSYTIVAADLNHDISVEVIATAPDGTTVTGMSDQFPINDRILPGKPWILTAPEASAPLAIKYAANSGTWRFSSGADPSAFVDLHVQWYRDGWPIWGATDVIYTPTAADIGHRISLCVTGTKTGLVTVSAMSSSVTVPIPAVDLAVAPGVGASGGTARLATGTDWYTLTATVKTADGTPLPNLGTGLQALASSARVQLSNPVNNGDGTYSFTAVSSTPGRYSIQMLGGGRLLGNAVTVNFLGASASPATVQQGKQLTITGTGFQPGELVTVGSDLSLPDGSITANAAGVATLRITLDSSAALGSHTVLLTGATSGATSATFTVVAPSQPQPQPKPNSWWWFPLGWLPWHW